MHRSAPYDYWEHPLLSDDLRDSRLDSRLGVSSGGQTAIIAPSVYDENSLWDGNHAVQAVYEMEEDWNDDTFPQTGTVVVDDDSGFDSTEILCRNWGNYLVSEPGENGTRILRT